jgi:hypothetical protein
VGHVGYVGYAYASRIMLLDVGSVGYALSSASVGHVGYAYATLMPATGETMRRSFVGHVGYVSGEFQSHCLFNYISYYLYISKIQSKINR